RRRHVLDGEPLMMLDTSEIAVVCSEIVGGLPPRLSPPRNLNTACQGRGDRVGEFVLDREQIPYLPVVPVSPNVRARYGIDELCTDADPICRPAHTALDQVLHAQPAADFRDPHWLAAKYEGGIAGDDEQLPKARQLGDDVFGDAVAEILLLGIPA